MKNLAILFFISILLFSCGSSKKTSKNVIIDNNPSQITEKKVSKNRTKSLSKRASKKAEVDDSVSSEFKKKASKIVNYAKTFEGTRYKFGGTDKKGMDCSGLVYTSFQNENITLPRISRDMATQGIPITLKEIEEGDLIFFQTNKKRRIINHVGIVIETKRGEIYFIHSTTSKGVIVSSLDEDYWKNAFVEVRRII